jgi:hypothetical protein
MFLFVLCGAWRFSIPRKRQHTFTGIHTQFERDDAEFGRWNGAMFESGMHLAGALAAPARCSAGMLQQLRCAAAQRAAAAATAVSDARAADAELPAHGTRALMLLRA